MLNYIAIGFVMISLPIQYFFLHRVLKREITFDLRSALDAELRVIVAPIIHAELKTQLDDKLNGVIAKLDQRAAKLHELDGRIQELVVTIGETAKKIEAISNVLPTPATGKSHVSRR